MKVCILHVCFLSLSLFACRSSSPNSSQVKEVVEFNDTAGMAIGAGVNALDLSVKGDCVVRTPLESAGQANSQSVTFALEKVENFQSLSEKLDVRASAKVSAGVGSISAKASFLESQNINKFSVYVLVKVIVFNVAERMRDVELKPSLIALLGAPGGEKTFRERCGDEFIVGRTTGGEFYSLIEIRTSSTEQKKEIEAKMSGRYGSFSAKGSFQQTLSEIAKISSLNVYLFQKGGNTSSVMIDADGMIQQAANFPGEVEKKPYPYLATTASYKTLDLPAAAQPIDISNQQLVIAELAKEKMLMLDNLSNVSYVLANQGEFQNIQLDSLNFAADQLRKNINIIHQTASACTIDLAKCLMPQGLTVPSISIPERVKGQVSETGCKTPLYNTKVDPICGAATYNVKSSPACGVAQYMQGSGGPCGISSYKSAASPACGVNLYKLGTQAVCGVTEEQRVIEVQGDRKLLWASHPENLAKGNELCKGRVGPEWEIVTWEHPPRQIGFNFTRKVTCKKVNVGTCRNPAFGIETYNTCRHESHGVESFNSCRDPAFGVESYNACAHESHGVESYKACSNPLFGYMSCAD